MKTNALSVAVASRAQMRALAAALLLALAPAAATGAGAVEKTYFFASPEACAASGAFTAPDCAAAFANALLQLRDLAPAFASALDCRGRFQLCAPLRAEGSDATDASRAPLLYAPLALGVEMTTSPQGDAVAAPTLAVETRPRLFPYFPVARAYAAQRAAAVRREPARNSAILAADHFEPFSKRANVEAVTFAAAVLGDVETGAPDAPSETPDQRRARLKAAPLVQ